MSRAELIRKMMIQSVIGIAAQAILLFVPAGTLNWPAAWFLLVELNVFGLAMGLWLLAHDPALMSERL
jgi:hypothetical protein